MIARLLVNFNQWSKDLPASIPTYMSGAPGRSISIAFPRHSTGIWITSKATGT